MSRNRGETAQEPCIRQCPKLKRKHARAWAHSPGCNLENDLRMSTSRYKERDQGLTSRPLVIFTESSLTADSLEVDPNTSALITAWRYLPDPGYPCSESSRASMKGAVGEFDHRGRSRTRPCLKLFGPRKFSRVGPHCQDLIGRRHALNRRMGDGVNRHLQTFSRMATGAGRIHKLSRNRRRCSYLFKI